MVKVSIIIPVYNSGSQIVNAVSSVISQSLKDVEVVCVDDGSTDDTKNILNELSDKHDFLKVFSQENSGSGSARNKGICEASGEYVAFLDADDIFVDEDALSIMYDYGIKNDACMIGANLKRVSVDDVIEDNFNYKQDNYTYFSDFGVISASEYGVPWAFYKNMYKRSFLVENNITFPDLKRGQDPVFLSKVLVKVDKIYTTPVNLYGYNYSAGGGADSKVDTFTKKHDYIKNFHDSFNILENGGLYNNACKYKEKLYQYMRIKDNREDKDLLDILRDVFNYSHEYFGNIDEEVLYLRLKLLNYDNEDVFIMSFNNLINDLKDINIKSDFLINHDILSEYVEILDKHENLLNTINYNLDEFKELNEENKHLNDEILLYKNKNDELKKTNDSLTSSTSWKITKPLRMIRNR